jgi:hypothetical protein
LIDLDTFIATPSAMTRGNSYKAVVERAFEILKSSDRWTQGVFARTASGDPVAPVDPSACQWCLLGAMAVSSNEFGFIPPPLLRFLDEMLHFIYGDKFATVGEMNDYIDHDLLLDFMSRVLARFNA